MITAGAGITYKLINILNYGRKDTEHHFPGVLFQRFHLNMEGISIQDRSQDDYGNHSPTKDLLIQDFGRILPFMGSDILIDED